MLQLFHRYKKTVVGALFLLVLAVTLTGLGLDSIRMASRGSDGGYAIRVNDAKVSFTELARLKGNSSEQDPQRVIDRAIAGSLLEQKSSEFNLAAGEQAIRRFIQSNIFQGSFSADEYRAFLSQIGMTSRMFEEEIRRDVIKQQLASILTDSISPTKQEISHAIEQFDSTFDLTVASIDPSALTKNLGQAITDEEIESFYSSNSEKFEIPQGVSYEYILFTPESYLTAVPVSPEDIEFYYSENTESFKVPAALNARRIRILYPKDSSPEEMNKVKERAVLAHSRAQAGESFDALVNEYSDDLVTKTKGGELGLLSKGVQSPEFDAIVFSQKRVGITPLIEADYGFEIVEITNYTPESVKPLQDVRDEIAKILQQQEAPIYASNRANEIFTELKASGAPLAQFAAERGLKVEKTAGILSVEEDPSAALKGFTSKVIEDGSDLAVIDIDDKVALVKVVSRRDSDIAALSAVRGEVITSITRDRALVKAREEVKKLRELAMQPNSSLAALAKSGQFEVKEFTEVSPIAPKQGLPTSPTFLRDLSNIESDGKLLAGEYELDGKIALVQVTKRLRPTAEKIKEREAIFASVSRSQIGNLLLQSFIEREKAKSQIDINPQAL